MEELRSTAFHRAGHAVVALHLSIAGAEVSLRATADNIGDSAIPDWVRPHDELDDRGRSWLDDHVQVAWAGVLAEVEGCGAALAAALAAAPGDLARIEELAAYVASEREELDAYVEWMRCRTLNVLRHAWVAPQLPVVANALLERGVLSGREVRALARTGHPAYAKAADQPGPAPDRPS